MTPEQQHLDLDALADVLAGDDEPAHLADCASCRGRLIELRTADEQIRAELAALPDPPLPEGLGARLDAAFAAERPSVTTLPVRTAPRPGRWLPAAAAAVLLLGGATYAATRSGGAAQDSATSAAGDSAGQAETTSNLVRNDTGTAYDDRAALAAAVPRLLAGTARLTGALPPSAAGSAQDSTTLSAPAADPLARLRTPQGLAECLLGVLPPDDPSVRPLALDYGSFRGRPAMVLLLPSPLPKKVDAYVLGPGCSRADAQVLFYTAVDAP
ncbi:MAG: hypothetical protein LC789_12960 [Actinobacteria bacterium]|nr:hypothetical protein [Actinomycetota bacterium]MCA1722084.1 hypothetical protein [Actinomycetota bacterium]